MTFTDLSVIYEDEHTIVVNKPIGLATQHNDKTQVSLESILNTKYEYIHFVNRLDQPVGGLIIIALSRGAARYYDKCISKGTIHKKYHAITEGIIEFDHKILQHELKKKGNKSIVAKGGKQATSSIKTLFRLERFSVIEVQLMTGRFHQIRCQLSAIGHPIKGDLKYGAKRSNPEGGIYLVCRELKFSPYNTWSKDTTFEVGYPNMRLWGLATKEMNP